MMQRLLQFTLDLFDSAPAPLPKEAGGPKAKKSKPKRPVAQVPHGQPAIEKIAEVEFTGPKLPAQSLQQALAPATFRHPRATRETVRAEIAAGPGGVSRRHTRSLWMRRGQPGTRWSSRRPRS